MEMQIMVLTIGVSAFMMMGIVLEFLVIYRMMRHMEKRLSDQIHSLLKPTKKKVRR